MHPRIMRKHRKAIITTKGRQINGMIQPNQPQGAPQYPLPIGITTHLLRICII
jgi:hypothetical protein